LSITTPVYPKLSTCFIHCGVHLIVIIGLGMKYTALRYVPILCYFGRGDDKGVNPHFRSLFTTICKLVEL